MEEGEERKENYGFSAYEGCQKTPHVTLRTPDKEPFGKANIQNEDLKLF